VILGPIALALAAVIWWYTPGETKFVLIVLAFLVWIFEPLMRLGWIALAGGM
jgi:hypothetical protein